jgi:DNA polymerase-1
MCLHALCGAVLNSYQVPASSIAHSAHYPSTLADIATALDSLNQYPVLSCDIEAFRLRFNEAGIGSIAFAWDQHNGVAFPWFCPPVLLKP